MTHMERQQSKHWVLTVNNPEPHHERLFRDLDCTYAVFGREKGESGTPHLQAYVIFKNRKTFTSVKKIFSTAHIERARGTPQEASDYCKKDGDFEEFGEIPPDGGSMEKRRWEEVKEKAKAGDLDGIPADIYVRYYNTLKKIKADHQVVPPAQDTLDFHWYYGESGAGKSSTARKENPGAYIKNCNKWWDGYTDQQCAIIEDVGKKDAEWIGDFLKRWCDHHPFSAETKGATICIRPPRIICTSNYSLDQLFGHDSNILEPLKRRFKIKHFSKLA